ncbi:MAG: tetratricopeptide repeat protein [Acidobacteriota bacterium]|nr:tetratricopeptide repeat protein [Acidobacteriota bacterium]
MFNRFRFKIVFLAIFLMAFSMAKAFAADVAIIMPFENRSQSAQFNWVRESFSILLADILDAPGLTVVSADERLQAFDQVRLSPTDLLTRAAMIRVAEAAKANLVVVGEFDIGGDKQNVSIAISARLIETEAGRLIGNKVFNFSGPLSDLQLMQGQLAWHVLYERNPSLTYTKEQLVRRATNVPPRAYESYVKGVQTLDLRLRESFLKRAIQEHDTAGAPGHYAQAIYELGVLQYRQTEFEEAVTLLKRLTKGDPHYEQGLFYLGQAAFKAGVFNDAAAALETLAGIAPLPEILNNAGAALTAKGENARALPFLQRAIAANANDTVYRFNYGYAAWRNQAYEDAAQQLRAVVGSNARDGEAWFVLSKCLASAEKAEEAAKADNEAKRYLSSYARWAVAPDKVPVLARVKEDLDELSLAKLLRQQSGTSAQTRATPQQISQQQALDNIRQLLAANKDAEAMAELQRVLAADTANADAYFLRGIVYTRRNETENALRSFQAAVSWNPRMPEAHIMLGRIYLVRRDTARALAHCKQALEIDPQNREAIALKQQIEIGR